MKDRIRRLMDSQNLSQQSFADKIQISPASLSSIFNDRTKPTLNHVDAIMKSFPGLNILWLLYGQGEMFAPAENSPVVVDEAPSAQQQTVAHVGQQQSVAGRAAQQQADLFADYCSPAPSQSFAQAYQQERPQIAAVQFNQRQFENAKNLNKPQRQITEIRIFYDDQTWETFVPKK